MSFIGTQRGLLVAATDEPQQAGGAVGARNAASSDLPPIQFPMKAATGSYRAAHAGWVV